MAKADTLDAGGVGGSPQYHRHHRRYRHRHHSSEPSNQSQMSSQPVEARSLSGITSIASNPPAYPRNPTQKKLESLVLYIMRVPGSKDVFLTPLKPPTKWNVSVESINSSLYYLHAASPGDYALLQKSRLEREDEEERLREEQLLDGEQANRASASPELLGRLNHFRRKPVPGSGSTGSACGNGNGNGPRMSADIAITEPQDLDGQFDSGSDQQRFLGEAQFREATRRSFPSVPNEEPLNHAEDVTLNPNPNRWSALPGRLDTNLESLKALEGNRKKLSLSGSIRSRMRPHSTHGVPSYTTEAGRSAAMQERFPFQGTSYNDPDETDLHITLVRRDPSHGAQWNVATMSAPRTDSDVINIDISTPGYTKFAGRNEPLSSMLGTGVNIPPQIRDAATSINSNVQPARDRFNPGRFSRELRASKQQQQQQQQPSQQDLPRSSVDACARPSLDGPVGNNSSYGSKLKSGYYSFLSPWDGMCTFSASLNGQSLKCKHVIPGPPSANGTETPAVTVAELRFNTPFQMAPTVASYHSTVKDLSDAKESTKRHTLSTFLNPNAYSYSSTSTSGTSNYYNNYSSNRPRSRSGVSMNSNLTTTPPPRSRGQSFSSSGNDDPSDENSPPTSSKPPRRSPERDEERLDFSLARENAGGGMKGDEAKLGKLIIEDEGIKMLDLVVAASMAVWWRAYYR